MNMAYAAGMAAGTLAGGGLAEFLDWRAAPLLGAAVSAAETGALDLHRRAGIGVAVVAADRAHVVEVLDAAERLVASRPEIELLSARRDLRRPDD
jgi:MFS family permease